MIYYFSGTGNSKFVALQLAKLLQDNPPVFILDPSAEKGEIKTNESIGFVFPIYAWGTPKVMIDFIKNWKKNHPVLANHFIYGVATCGENAGNAFAQIQRYIPLHSAYTVAMPNNYVIGYELETKEQVKEIVQLATLRLQTIAHEIEQKQPHFEVSKGSLPAFKTALVAPMMARFAPFLSRQFYADDHCTSCGLCVKACPFHNIEMINQRPHWKNQCNLCLSCINRCPSKAIQHGKNTQNRRRYYFDI